MSEPSTEIRAAGASEVPDVVASVVAAFITDPIARFAWPSPHAYLTNMPEMAGAFGDASVAHDAAVVSDDFRGAALWLPPGAHVDGERLGVLFRDTAEKSHFDDLVATFAKMAEAHPEDAHWYLAMVGVEPHAQGSGVGGALMRHAIARCDAEGAVAYLESSNPRNVSLYQRHGFEVTGEIQVGAAPVVTPMIRQPR